MGGLIRRSGNASDYADIMKHEEAQTSNFTDTHLKSSRIPFDTTAGALTCTLPDPKTVKKNSIKRIGIVAGSNPVTITNTIEGEDTPVVDSIRASLTVMSNGQNWFRFDEDLNQFDIARETNTLRVKSPFLFKVDALSSGTESAETNISYASFGDLDINVDDNGVSLGNTVAPKSDNEVDGATVTYSGGASSNATTINGSWDEAPVQSDFNNGLVYEIDLGAGNEEAINAIQYSKGGGGGNNYDFRLSWSDDGISWTPMYEFIGANYGGSVHELSFENNVGAKRHWQLIAANDSNLGQRYLYWFKLRVNEAATTGNTFETNLGVADVSISAASLKGFNESGDVINDDNILVQYSLDNKVTWSAQETLSEFKTRGILNTSDVFELKVAAVGLERISSLRFNGPSVDFRATESGLSFFVNDVKVSEFNLDGKLLENGQSVTARLDTLENNPTQEVADIDARDALTPANGEIVKVFDDGSGETKVFKWDGSQWNDITHLSKASVQELSDRLALLENTPEQVVFDIAARDALTPSTGEVVQVEDDGSGNTKVYKWDGATWNDITATSTAYALSVAQEAKTQADKKSILRYPAMCDHGPSFTITSTGADHDSRIYSQTSGSKPWTIAGNNFVLESKVFVKYAGDTRRIVLRGTYELIGKPDDNATYSSLNLDCFVYDKNGAAWELVEHSFIEGSDFDTGTNFIDDLKSASVSHIADNGASIITNLQYEFKTAGSYHDLRLKPTWALMAVPAAAESEFSVRTTLTEHH